MSEELKSQRKVFEKLQYMPIAIYVCSDEIA